MSSFGFPCSCAPNTPGWTAEGKSRGVIITQGSEEQVTNWANFYMLLIKLDFIPITEFRKTVELWKKMEE